MKDKTIITLVRDTRYGSEVVKLCFNFNNALIKLVKTYPGARWSRTLSGWYIPLDRFDLDGFAEYVSGLARVGYIPKGQRSVKIHLVGSNLKEKTSVKYPGRSGVDLPKGYLEKLKIKRYSESTVRTYTAYFKDFMIFFDGVELEDITVEDINNYLLELIESYNISGSQQNQRINAIKFYYEKVLGLEKRYFYIERPRKKSILPEVFSKKEVQNMIKVTTNLKHKCILVVIYSCGLRRSEAINLTLEHINKQRKIVDIKGAKGGKDRVVQLAEFTLKTMEEYLKKYSPKRYLFEGVVPGEMISETTIVKVIKGAAKKSGITRRVYPHMLRHSYATHHLEQGTDLRYIQEFLGHNSSKTTERYTHVSKKDISRFKNPIDDIGD